jgi:hypothetical protein
MESNTINQKNNQPTPTQHKMWAWVTRAWETCPTDLSLQEWYEKFREELWEMYTASQNPIKQTKKEEEYSDQH